MVLYSFDTSSLLNGRRDLLPPDVFGSLWDNIEAMIEAGCIRCVDTVRDELSRFDDEVGRWCAAMPHLFIALEPDVQRATTAVLSSHGRLLAQGKPGRNGADPLVIGLAVARGATVVTEERASGKLEKPKIPDVCAAMSVPCLNLVGFVRQQGWRF